VVITPLFTQFAAETGILHQEPQLYAKGNTTFVCHRDSRNLPELSVKLFAQSAENAGIGEVGGAEYHAKSPARTSTQVTAVDQVDHKLMLNVEPLEMPVHHPPVCSARPVMSALPSPLKSPT